jgi:polysaccharide biosynthesis/export protein
MQLKFLQKTYLFLAIFSCNFILAQQPPLDLNEDFLASLPKDIREDLLKQIEADQDSLENVDFGTFSTKLDENAAKKFIDQELLENETLRSPLDMLPEDLKVFGTDFFKGIPITFNPINTPAMRSDYLLDVGDKVTVSVIGASNFTEETTVALDGSLNIAKLGKLRVAGFSLSQAEKNLQKFVADRMTGAEAYLSISSVKNIQVLVVGMAKVPGVYTLAGNSTLLSSLNAAGGIADNGSYRNIKLVRNGKELTNFDLYALMVDGDLTNNVMLQSGDSIVITPALGHVSIYGGVRKPAKYEPQNDSIKDLLRYAGGLIDLDITEVNWIDYSNGKFETKELLASDTNTSLVGPRDSIYASYNNITGADTVEFLGSFSTIGKFSPSQANKLLKDLVMSNDAYPLGVLHIQKGQANKNHSYNFIDLESISAFTPQDQLISFSNREIQFINSNFLKDYFGRETSLNKQEIKSCNLFSYLENIQNTSRYKLAESIIMSFANKAQNLDPKNLNQIPDNPLPADLDSRENYLGNKNLFTSQQLDQDQCPRIFAQYPEVLLSLIMQSALVEGVNFRSGLYPIPENLKTKDLISYTAMSSDLSGVEATITNKMGQSSSVDLAGLDNFISRFDKLSFATSVTPKIQKVFIDGEVHKPGYYYVGEEESLSDLLTRAGSITKNAYPMGGVLLRESAALLEEEYNKSLYDQVIKSLATVVTRGKAVQLGGLELILSEFKNLDSQGRIITEFNPVRIRRDASLDTLLEDGDKIFIPKRNGIIYVFGDVLRPGPQKYLAGQDFSHYISKAGGFTQFADKDFVIKVGPNGESELAKKALFRSKSSVLPGSVIYVSRDLQKLENIEFASTIAPIISSIAISIASLNSISNK